MQLRIRSCTQIPVIGVRFWAISNGDLACLQGKVQLVAQTGVGIAYRRNRILASLRYPDVIRAPGGLIIQACIRFPVTTCLDASGHTSVYSAACNCIGEFVTFFFCPLI